MEMVYYQVGRSSYQDLLKELEADIQHANALVAAIPKPKKGVCLHMKLEYNQLSPLLYLLLQWLDSSCSCLFPLYFNLFNILIYEVYPDGRTHISTQGSKATVREFYAIILPSLTRLHNDLVERESRINLTKKSGDKENFLGQGRLQNVIDQEREDECGICLVPTTKMVLPGCCHAMCINCYRNWNTKSASCPFCRGGLKRVKSEDLWVLTSESEVIDAEAVSTEELSRFYLYIQSLPKDKTEAPFWVYYNYLT
ncbi:LON peptidase N-terminal domain and RING finger protein 1-like [Chenopodium quinoa]|uniref:RING-type domain-containing protein n=1 Tax=Chenopodium quinoa TaxID=63459 RepID=A0A803L108_CHEQI|nr:LON peptidase N-terminal domain and RING finger protein 1-like [Chenopodium quinoa]